MERYRAWHEPTEDQIASGNYRKRLVRWNGLTIRVENEAGSVRSGKKPDGTPWETRMLYPYGYIVGSVGTDRDPVDVFLGPNPDAAMVYVVRQRKVDNWSRYDEDKAMVGFDSEEDARQAFLRSYDDERFLGPITAMPAGEFTKKVKATKEGPKMIKGIFLWRLKG